MKEEVPTPIERDHYYLGSGTHFLNTLKKYGRKYSEEALKKRRETIQRNGTGSRPNGFEIII